MTFSHHFFNDMDQSRLQLAQSLFQLLLGTPSQPSENIPMEISPQSQPPSASSTQPTKRKRNYVARDPAKLEAARSRNRIALTLSRARAAQLSAMGYLRDLQQVEANFAESRPDIYPDFRQRFQNVRDAGLELKHFLNSADEQFRFPVRDAVSDNVSLSTPPTGSIDHPADSSAVGDPPIAVTTQDRDLPQETSLSSRDSTVGHGAIPVATRSDELLSHHPVSTEPSSSGDHAAAGISTKSEPSHQQRSVLPSHPTSESLSIPEPIRDRSPPSTSSQSYSTQLVDPIPSLPTGAHSPRGVAPTGPPTRRDYPEPHPMGRVQSSRPQPTRPPLPPVSRYAGLRHLWTTA